MCLLAFLAVDAPLIERPWSDARPGLHVAAIGGHDEAVRSVFSKPHVFYLGSHEGCGCGFRHVWGAPEVPRNLSPFEFRGGEPEESLTAQSTTDLVAFLRLLAAEQGVFELYSCWDGNQAAPPLDRVTIDAEDLSEAEFYLLEGRHYTVHAGAA